MGTAMEKYLYFRTVADEDDDDAITAGSVLVPVSKITGFYPSNSGQAGEAADELTIFFESINNIQTAGDNEVVKSDSVLLNITAATQTGPIKLPLPTSSTPATIFFIKNLAYHFIE